MQLLVVLMVLAAIIIYRVTVLYAMSIIMGYGKAKMFILVTAGALQVIAIAALNAVSYCNLTYDLVVFFKNPSKLITMFMTTFSS